jgi:hypothetical protein
VSFPNNVKDSVCVTKLCVTQLCEALEREDVEAEEKRDTESKIRTPHEDVGNNPGITPKMVI